jgi:hypothetical protein
LPRRRKLISPTSRLTRAGRARRRFNCLKQEEWDERAVTAIDLLLASRETWKGVSGSPPAIADFGAGNERLRSLLEAALPEPADYRPYDLHPQHPTTTRLDASRGLPDVEFDIAICLGLLEYLPSVDDLARELARVCRFALVSYVTSDSPAAITEKERIEHGWRTHLRGEEVEAAFAAAGFRSVGERRSDREMTTIWLWEASPR